MAGQIKNSISNVSVSAGSLSTELNKPYERRSSPVIGTIKDIPSEGLILVEWNEDQEANARVSAALEDFPPEYLIGREVLLLFEDDNPGKPIVISLLQSRGEIANSITKTSNRKNAPEIFVDGENVVIKASKKIELRVGKASIVIDENGKITTRGEHLLNRATGPIRIKGGHVDIN